MLFRFGIHAALSSAVLVAAAATAPGKGESETTPTTPTKTEDERSMNDAVPANAFPDPSAETNLYEASKAAGLRNPTVVREGSSQPFENEPPGSAGTNENDPNDEKEGLLQPALRPVPSLSENRHQHLLRAKRLKNPSFDEKEGARHDGDAEVFDASSELGILDRQAVDKARELQENCDGKSQVVDPTMNFQNLVKRCLYYKDDCPYDTTLGLNCWDTSEVTNMSHAFHHLEFFNEPIDSWNTEAVSDMSDMFGLATSFNQPLESWNTSAVIDMSDMFWGASSFNQPVDSWDTAAVVNMDYMFLGARVFGQPLGGWNTGAVQGMQYMFAYAPSFNQPIETWNTKAVTTMMNMFAYALSFDQPLAAWDTSSVGNMNGMFFGALSFNQQVDSWNISAATNIGHMFNDAESFNQCLSTWAYKNPTTYIGEDIFSGTSCPYSGIQNRINGPWCEGPCCQCYPSTTASSGNSLFGWSQLISAVLLGIVIPNAVL